jgi:hypothetical protein
MHRVRDARRHIADRRETRDRAQISRDILARHVRKNHRQHAAIGQGPDALRHGQLVQRVAAGIDGMRRQETDEQVGALDRRADLRVEGLTGLQVLAIVENVVPLLRQREPDRLDASPVFGRVAEEYSHLGCSVA